MIDMNNNIKNNDKVNQNTKLMRIRERNMNRFKDMVDYAIVDIADNAIEGSHPSIIAELLAYAHAEIEFANVSENEVYDYIENSTGYSIEELNSSAYRIEQ